MTIIVVSFLFCTSYFTGITILSYEDEEMIVAVKAIYAIAKRTLKKIQDFNTQIRQRRAMAKADHLCIDLLSQLAAEQ